jgi:hypothetical protein
MDEISEISEAQVETSDLPTDIRIKLKAPSGEMVNGYRRKDGTEYVTTRGVHIWLGATEWTTVQLLKKWEKEGNICPYTPTRMKSAKYWPVVELNRLKKEIDPDSSYEETITRIVSLKSVPLEDLLKELQDRGFRFTLIQSSPTSQE